MKKFTNARLKGQREPVSILVEDGKTSICRELLDKIPNSIILHGGNLYRGIVFALMSSGADMNKIMHGTDKPIDIKQMMDILKVELKIEKIFSTKKMYPTKEN